MRTRTATTLLMAALLATTGCLGLFGDEGEELEEADSTDLEPGIGGETEADIQARAGEEFRNYTVPGQVDLPPVIKWLNGTVGPGQGMASAEDRNDRSGINYNTEYVTEDLSGDIEPGQPVMIRAKVWYFAGPGNATDLDIYMNVPGTETDLAGDDCDQFSWKVCVQELTVPTVGVEGEPMEVGVQVANSVTGHEMPYFMEVEIDTVGDVITPYVPYAVEVPENATGIEINSEKAGGSEHVRAELLVVGPDDELVTVLAGEERYDDIAIPTESKFIPVEQPGEHIVYILEMSGGFLSVESDAPVPDEQREIRPVDRVEETVTDAQAPAPGTGGYCVPGMTGEDCTTEMTYNEGGSSQFSVDGAFPLKVTGWINEEGSPDAHANAEVRISSEEGMVHKLDKFVQYEDERGTLGMTRDEWHQEATWGNLAKGEYTVSYVIDGTGSVGHTLVTYER